MNRKEEAMMEMRWAREMAQEMKQELREADQGIGCLYPVGGRRFCGAPAIGGHTVQKAELRKIADREGKVYSGMQERVADDEGCVIFPEARPPQKVYVRQASVTPIMCSEHDGEAMKVLEQHEYVASYEQVQAALLRAAMKERLNREAGRIMSQKGLEHCRAGAVQARKDGRMNQWADLVSKNAENRIVSQIRQMNKLAKKLNREIKANCPGTRESRKRSRVRAVTFWLRHRLPILGTGMFIPESIDGKVVQDLTRGQPGRGAVAWIAGNNPDRGWICLATRLEEDNRREIGEDYIMAYAHRARGQGREDCVGALVATAFLRLENLYMNPEWWEGLPEQARASLWDLASVSDMDENDMVEGEKDRIVRGLALELDRIEDTGRLRCR